MIVVVMILLVLLFILCLMIKEQKKQLEYTSKLSTAGFQTLARCDDPERKIYKALKTWENSLGSNDYDKVISALCAQYQIPFELGEDGLITHKVRDGLASHLWHDYYYSR